MRHYRAAFYFVGEKEQKRKAERAVGTTGFEPATSRSQSALYQAELHPEASFIIHLKKIATKVYRLAVWYALIKRFANRADEAASAKGCAC